MRSRPRHTSRHTYVDLLLLHARPNMLKGPVVSATQPSLRLFSRSLWNSEHAMHARPHICNARSPAHAHRSTDERNLPESTALHAPLLELGTCDGDCAPHHLTHPLAYPNHCGGWTLSKLALFLSVVTCWPFPEGACSPPPFSTPLTWFDVHRGA